MQEALINLLLDAQRNYNHTDLNAIREIEKYFNFDSINDEGILKLAKYIEEESKVMGPISLRIRNINKETIYKYIAPEKSERNIIFGGMKGNVVYESKHMSFYPLIMYAIGFKEKEYFEKENFLPVAGAFPVYENNELKYVIEVSGLHEGKDYHVVIKGLEKYINMEIPEYKGYLI